MEAAPGIIRRNIGIERKRADRLRVDAVKFNGKNDMCSGNGAEKINGEQNRKEPLPFLFHIWPLFLNHEASITQKL